MGSYDVPCAVKRVCLLCIVLLCFYRTSPKWCALPRQKTKRYVFAAPPQIRAGTVALLYVSPERFNNERFVNVLKGVKVALFVVDEAHCISEVGEHEHIFCAADPI